AVDSHGLDAVALETPHQQLAVLQDVVDDQDPRRPPRKVAIRFWGSLGRLGHGLLFDATMPRRSRGERSFEVEAFVGLVELLAPDLVVRCHLRWHADDEARSASGDAGDRNAA